MGNTIKTPQEIAVAVSTVKAMLRSGSDQEAALQYLRNAHHYQIDSIKVMRAAIGISTNDAKKLVHFSRTWEDQRAASEAIHEAAFQVLEEMRKEDSE